MASVLSPDSATCVAISASAVSATLVRSVVGNARFVALVTDWISASAARGYGISVR